jgi:hypothetical protein
MALDGRDVLFWPAPLRRAVDSIAVVLMQVYMPVVSERNRRAKVEHSPSDLLSRTTRAGPGGGERVAGGADPGGA